MDETIPLLAVHLAPWRLGWALILTGFLSGALLGLGFRREDFLGGYGSFRRRIARLGHVALVALGMLNLAFALSPWPASGTDARALAAWSFALGAVLMPGVCFLSAWRDGFRHLFFLPVAALVTAVVTVLAHGPS